MSERNFDDVELGDDLPDLEPDVSMSRVLAFADATGMHADRFTDHEKAKAEGLPGAIVPGIMSQGLLASMIHSWAPGCQIHKLDAVFRAPVMVDSTPICSGVVTDTDEQKRCVEIDLTIVNERGETRVVGTATVELA